MGQWLGKGKLRQIKCLTMRPILEATILLIFDQLWRGSLEGMTFVVEKMI